MIEGNYKCERCGGEFLNGWSEKEAEAEAVALWGDIKPEDQVTLCDDCFKKMMAWYREKLKHEKAANNFH